MVWEGRRQGEEGLEVWLGSRGKRVGRSTSLIVVDRARFSVPSLLSSSRFSTFTILSVYVCGSGPPHLLPSLHKSHLDSFFALNNMKGSKVNIVEGPEESAKASKTGYAGFVKERADRVGDGDGAL